MSIIFYKHNLNFFTSLTLYWIVPALTTFGIITYLITGQYTGITRYYSNVIIYQLTKKNILIVSLLALFGAVFKLPMPPKTFWLFLWILINSSTILIKLSLIDFITQFQKRNANVTRVAIYGAGEAGALLASSLNFLGGYRIKTFLDDNSNLWSRNINGIPIKAPQALANLTEEIDQILLAIPSLKYNEKKNILNSLSNYPFKVLQIPSIKNITSVKNRYKTLTLLQLKIYFLEK